MKNRSKVEHVTQADGNLFLDIGFPPEEAARLLAETDRQIDELRALKQQLMDALTSWIDEHHLKQADAARILMVSRPRVSDVVNKKVGKFTLDTLVGMLSRVGKPVTLSIG